MLPWILDKVFLLFIYSPFLYFICWKYLMTTVMTKTLDIISFTIIFYIIFNFFTIRTDFKSCAGCSLFVSLLVFWKTFITQNSTKIHVSILKISLIIDCWASKSNDWKLRFFNIDDLVLNSLYIGLMFWFDNLPFLAIAETQFDLFIKLNYNLSFQLDLPQSNIAVIVWQAPIGLTFCEAP